MPDIKTPTMKTEKIMKMDICVTINARVSFFVLAWSNSLFYTFPVAAMNTHHLYKSNVNAKKRNISFSVSKLFAMQSAILELK